MIGITTPFVTLVLGIIGTILTGLSLIKKQKRQDNKRRYLILIFVFTIVPFLYATFGNPTIYNGWRHFYFLFGPFLIFAVYAVKVLMQKKHIQRILLIVLAIQIMVSAAGILRNHPNEFAYFNILAGADADEYYEMDYWNVSTLQCLIDLVNAEYRGETLKVAAYEDCAEEGIKKALRFLPGDYINRLEILDFSRREEAEYLIVNPSYQQRSDLIWGQFNEGVRTILLKKELNQVLSIDSYGRKIMTVYKWKK